MKNRILRCSFFLMIAVNLLSCTEDKKAANKETIAPASETSASPQVSAASAVHPTEQKMYDLTSAFVEKIEAAIAEQDDNKAIAMLNSIGKEMEPRAKALKPEVESWMKSLSESEAKAFGDRMFTQPSTEKAYKMMGDPKLNERLQKNPRFKEAFENANAGGAEIWKGSGTQIEDSEE